MNLIMTLGGQILSLIEICIVVMFVSTCLEWKNQIVNPRVWQIGLGIILFFIAQGNGRFQNSYPIIVIVDIIILFIFSCIFLKGNIHIKILVCVSPFLIIAVSTILIIQIIASLSSHSVALFIKNTGYMFMAGAVLSKGILWISLKEIKKFLKSCIIYMTSRYVMIINILIIFTVSIELCLFYIINLDIVNSIAVKLLIFISFGMVLLSTYIIYSMVTISRQNEKLMKYELVKLENQENERRIQELKNSDRRIRYLRHDYMNHFLSMRVLLEKKEYERLAEYLEKITGTCQSFGEYDIQTNNAIIDAVLNSKIWWCREKDIDISCYVVGDVSSIAHIEMGIILFNLLDNAIEASIKNESEKRIECKIIKSPHEINIFVSNSIETSVLEKNGSLLTIKENKKEHGMGHEIVRNLVENMNGMLEYYEEEEFCVHIYLPLS